MLVSLPSRFPLRVLGRRARAHLRPLSSYLPSLEMAILHECTSFRHCSHLRSRLPQAQDSKGDDEGEVEEDGLGVSRLSPSSLSSPSGSSIDSISSPSSSGNGILIGGSTSTVRWLSRLSSLRRVVVV